MKKTGEVFRIVTASALFDGHDASINIFRRLFQKHGLEVIHLGHNRSVKQIVTTAIQEDADAVCISSYQGAHMEYFRYLRQLLNQQGGAHICIFGGGGGTILPSEIKELQKEGITRIYHAEDGRKIGLQGIVEDLISHLHKTYESQKFYQEVIAKIQKGQPLTDRELAKGITFYEDPMLYPKLKGKFDKALEASSNTRCGTGIPPVIGITGPGGAGKSFLIDELILRFLHACANIRIAILAFDPTKRQTGGALLGDRIRMNAIYNDRVFLRSMAMHRTDAAFNTTVHDALRVIKKGGFDLVIVETAGIGQADSDIVDISDLSILVMTNEYGAAMQLEKIDMLDLADIIVMNKSDKLGAQAAYDDIIHAYAHSHDLKISKKNLASIPVISTTASDFNNPGVCHLFDVLMQTLADKKLFTAGSGKKGLANGEATTNNALALSIIPTEKTFYLADIAHTVREYLANTKKLVEKASSMYRQNVQDKDLTAESEISQLLKQYEDLKDTFSQEHLSYPVRNKQVSIPLFTKSLSNLSIPKVALPQYREWGDIVAFMRQENFPGYFPYTAGVFPLKRKEEDPKRQFAGEGSPERTNKRFHYLSKDDPAKRLSTAFDAVTLYGEDPAAAPDIYGNIGNSGVSIATLEDMKSLYADFDLVDPLTSVSLTINGPAPILLAMFFNTAIDFHIKKVTGKQREEISVPEYERIKDFVLNVVRGTVQADILKEEQAQNECIFSSKFALKMMGDIQEYFITHHVDNFYSASISGYHIAEAGANPITQLAFTLANGFTMVEYYLARGMAIDDFASRLSFFFSSGMDPEYAVIGRVARKIWAIAMRYKYGANDRSCRFKYHIQTSGRSLHAQEINFNDIRTTLQALLAILDNCNSLHTNSYDEAITTPTQQSVRQAMAIQMILTKEYGLAKGENALQGSFFIQELTDLVEQAVLAEFESISRRGGVLGAMERQYQRHKIQTESMQYELLKSSGELPIVGVNTFLSDNSPTDYEHIEVVRASEQEKQHQIARTKAFIANAGQNNQRALERLRDVVLCGGNIFEELMETVRYCSLGQITHLLYACGGEYRRSM